MLALLDVNEITKATIKLARKVKRVIIEELNVSRVIKCSKTTKSGLSITLRVGNTYGHERETMRPVMNETPRPTS
jgi:hypothetical protein